MSTRSVIAKQMGDTWKGRYAHWDGYPAHMAGSLFHIVNRDGVEQAVKNLIEENFYWSSVNEFMTAEAELGIGYSDGRFKNVAGYGCAGTEEQSSPDEWWGPEEVAGSWVEWVYIISDRGLTILDVGQNKPFGFFRWDERHDWYALQEQWYSADEEVEV